MDKKSKEALRRYKKARQQESSSESSSSDSSSSSSYSSSDSEHHHRKSKKSMRRGSSSDEERRKREKREMSQKKLEARKQHLKRKLKEAKLRKRAALAVAALSSHSYRSLSPATQEKIKRIAEKEKLRTASKEHREREKHRARERERARHRESRSPSKMKMRLHQESKRQKSPPRMHHQMMSREKIIIQTRNRDRTPSEEREARQRHEHKLRHEEMLRERERRDRDRERAEREAARDKERAEALARCQERQRERERLAREKLRREEEEKKYGSSGNGERLMSSRTSERDLPLSRSYSSRERSLEPVERSRHISKREIEMYERDHEYMEAERRGLLDREDLRRELREYGSGRHREISPGAYSSRMRDPRDMYPEEERERSYKRGPYIEEARERESWMDPREMRERESREYNERDSELVYPDERERLIRERERKMVSRSEWKEDWQMAREHEWDEPGPSSRPPYGSLPKRPSHTITSNKLPPREKRPPSEQDWDVPETKEILPTPSASKPPESQREWIEHDQRDVDPPPPKPAGRTWQMDWREGAEEAAPPPPHPPHVRPPHMYMHPHAAVRGRGGYRRGGLMDHGERNPQAPGFRAHPPPLMQMPMHHPPGSFHGNLRFPHKRPMPPYLNMTVNIRKQQAQLIAAKNAAQASAVAAATTAVAAAKAAAQSAANSTTNPSILGQVAAGKPTPAILPSITTTTPTAGPIVAAFATSSTIVPSATAPPPITAPTSTEEKPEAGEITSEKPDEEKPIVVGGAVPAASAAGAVTEKVSGELSEISDSEDDILNKMEKKPKLENTSDPETPTKPEEPKVEAADPTAVPIDTTSDLGKDLIKEEPIKRSSSLLQLNDKEEDEKILDFEEISDGELEEEAKHKVGDALGVDWASLVAETKRHAESLKPNLDEHFTSAKQRWQPHHLILNLGLSVQMAGEEYARNVLTKAKKKIDEELQEIKIKHEAIKKEDDEQGSVNDNDDQPNANKSNDEMKLVIKQEPDFLQDSPINSLPATFTESPSSSSAVDIDLINLQPLACIQVAERRQLLNRQKLMANVCGANTRALSARQDLQLRRQLCGLPAHEFNLPHPLPEASNKLKTLALAAFQRSLEVK